MKARSMGWLLSIMAATLFFFDRITKCAALACYSSRCTFNDYLSFELVFNRGISWSFFHARSDFVFAIVSIVIVCITVLLGIYTFIRWRQHRLIIGEIWVLAGSVSNIVDRVLYRGVIDFIELSYNGFVWPLFNLADVCIVVGVGMMLIQQYREE